MSAIAACVGTACNAFYGIGETGLVDAPVFIDATVVDTDEDGVLDVVDVCPLIPNPMQEDSDGDRIGDVCDACPTGSNHNEDTDSLLDGCDNCPQIANDDQANDDGDDLGNACDPDPAVHNVRVRFEAFDALPDDWIPGNLEWGIDLDSVRITGMPGPNEYGLWNRRVTAAGASWSIETRVRFDSPVADKDTASIQSRTSVGSVQYMCYVQSVGGTSWIFGGQSSTPATIVLVDNTLRMRLYHVGNTVMCEANGVTAPNVGVVIENSTHPGITASTAKARFEYVDASSSVP